MGVAGRARRAGPSSTELAPGDFYCLSREIMVTPIMKAFPAGLEAAHSRTEA